MSQLRIGIVGGGQLASMLTDACEKVGLRCWVLDPHSQCPAVLAGANYVEGDSWNLAAARKLAAVVDVITVEIENVDVDNLALLEADGVKLIPGSDVLAKLVNKKTQKQVLQSAGLPTSAFLAKAAGEDIDVTPWGWPLVWKASRGGYDGRGVIVINNKNELPLCPDVEGYIEAFVDARLEIAVMVAVSETSEISTWTSVEMAFNPETNMLRHLIAPARVSQEVDKRARELAVEAIRVIGGAGIFGVEMFLTGEDELLINEIAPRTHNSGHFSMDAAETSQFEQQARILSGQTLLSTQQTAPAVMINILGKPGYQGTTVVENLGQVEQLAGAHVHFYGKRECFASRKMGHATITAGTIEKAIERAEEVQSGLVVRGAEQSG